MPRTLEQLIAERAARKELGDLPLSMTRNEADRYVAQTGLLDAYISMARNAQKTLADLTPKLEPLVKWCDDTTAWRAQFSKALPAVPRNPHDRAAAELSRGLAMGIVAIDNGAGTWPNGAAMLGTPLVEAIAAAGYTQSDRPGPYWLGSLPEVKRRIADIQQRIEKAQAQLAEALMDDAERAQRDTESAARIAKSRALPQRKTRADGTSYDKWPDGRCVEVS